jgi:uncharacterized membrane protein YoaK (UPF0700 family)
MLATATDALRTLAPPAGDRHGPLSPLLVTLTVVTGLVDAFSYLALGHVFVANMTGNVVFLAFALVGASGFSLAASLAALCAFAVGALVSGRMAVRLGGRRGRQLAGSTALQALLMAAALAVGWSAADPGSGTTRYVLIVLLGLASGVQNGTARRLAVPDLTTTVLTLTITGAAFDSRMAGGTGSRVGRRGLSVVAMFVGALVGAFLVLHVSRPLGLLCALILLVPVAVSSAHLSRAHPAWEQPV